jgi:glycosyltransferase involved in cell wall biosynthesis
MNVGIDARSLAEGRPTRAVAHYTSSVTEAITQAYPQDEWRPVSAGRLANAAGALLGRPRLDSLLEPRPDLLWAPAPAPLAVSPGVPLVLTVHDLSWLERPGDFTAYERLWHRAGRLGRLARRAARVMAVSHATRDAAIARWRLDPARVSVVGPAVSRPAGPIAPPPPQLPERYLLFVGALEPRKAPEVLAGAYARAREGGLDAGLVVVGDGRRRDVLAGPGVVRLGVLDDRSVLESLYAGALALVMPSWAEGFGLPPLEAAACGTPSVLSDLPSFRETLGEAAAFVAPGDVDGLARAMLEVASDPGLRERLAAEARARVEPRTWEACAHAVHGVFEEAIAG